MHLMTDSIEYIPSIDLGSGEHLDYWEDELCGWLGWRHIVRQCWKRQLSSFIRHWRDQRIRECNTLRWPSFFARDSHPDRRASWWWTTWRQLGSSHSSWWSWLRIFFKTLPSSDRSTGTDIWDSDVTDDGIHSSTDAIFDAIDGSIIIIIFSPTTFDEKLFQHF